MLTQLAVRTYDMQSERGSSEISNGSGAVSACGVSHHRKALLLVPTRSIVRRSPVIRQTALRCAHAYRSARASMRSVSLSATEEASEVFGIE